MAEGTTIHLSKLTAGIVGSVAVLVIIGVISTGFSLRDDVTSLRSDQKKPSDLLFCPLAPDRLWFRTREGSTMPYVPTENGQATH